MSAQLREGFLTVDEVAVYLRVSGMTVYRLLHQGKLPHIRVGRSFRISEGHAAAYLKIIESAQQEETSA
jgi:excisionase family DNA binding protein